MMMMKNALHGFPGPQRSSARLRTTCPLKLTGSWEEWAVFQRAVMRFTQLSFVWFVLKFIHSFAWILNDPWAHWLNRNSTCSSIDHIVRRHHKSGDGVNFTEFRTDSLIIISHYLMNFFAKFRASSKLRMFFKWFKATEDASNIDGCIALINILCDPFQGWSWSFCENLFNELTQRSWFDFTIVYCIPHVILIHHCYIMDELPSLNCLGTSIFCKCDKYTNSRFCQIETNGDAWRAHWGCRVNHFWVLLITRSEGMHS